LLICVNHFFKKNKKNILIGVGLVIILILVIVIIYFATKHSNPTPGPQPIGPLKPFPVPNIPSSYPITPIKTVELDKREDYATTTQFGFVDTVWPGTENSLYIDTINYCSGVYNKDTDKCSTPSQ
tara:strand:- start:150 stop:524 length:375 start_codon:yes stop_codon:yes gene_type:complete